MTTTKPEQQLPSPSISTTQPGGCLTPYISGRQNTPGICSGIGFQVWKPSGPKAGTLPLGHRRPRKEEKEMLITVFGMLPINIPKLQISQKWALDSK
ncbi:hypothetical protein AVEN_240558-1 [Araneus ventricosus]|uniref:Uncharacterized protein n=1 Tax=Araneus ventricosus TaxID=182803 RepID=A0A4Y2GT14_ARAVE|nr:hypothetical protein AVEN_240558-1 [Araneus ventricosus]